MIYLTGLSKNSLGKGDTGFAPAIVAAGPVITDPSTLSPKIWYSLRDATTLYSDNGVTHPSSGDGLYRINNKGSETIFWYQPTAGARPVLSSLNGQNAATFDGVDDFATTNDWLSATINQPWTLVAGAKFANAHFTIGNLFGGTTFNAVAFGADDDFTYRIYAGNSVVWSGTRDTTPHCYIIEYNGATTTFQIDNNAPVTLSGNPGTSGLSGALFMGCGNSGTQFFSGQVTDFMLFNGLVASGSKTGLVNYVKAGFGL